MTIDEQIEAALGRGDIAAAGRLAASIANPAAYLRAMLVVNAGMQTTKGNPKMISFNEHAAKLQKFECDIKVAGVDNPAPTAEIDIELNMSSELLAMFAPTLRSFLFHKSGAIQHDLASQTHDAPDVRFSELKFPLVWESRMEGATFTIHKGIGGKSDLVLPDATIKNFRLTPMEGGTVIVDFTVRSKPDVESAFGRLATMLKSEVSISLAPHVETTSDEGSDAGAPE